jgi:hypothetical protein
VVVAVLGCGQVAHAQPATRPQETFTGSVKGIVDETGAIANLYGTFQAAVALGQAFGILDDPNHDVLVQLQTLHLQIDQVAGEIIWFVEETDREKRLKDLNGTVHTTRDALAHGQPVDWFYVDDTSTRTVDEGEIPNAFKRHYRDADTDGALGDGNLKWKDVIQYTQDDLHYDTNDGSAYDWRLGVPALSQLVALRLTLMAMEDPNFTTDGRFHDALTDFHDALTSQIATMTTGVRCGVRRVTFSDAPSFGYVYWFSCADIYSGLNETHQLRDAVDPERNPTPYPDYNTWYAANIQSVQDQSYRHVRAKTSMFGVQALADTVFLFANSQPDLTRIRGRIPASTNPDLCLEAEAGFLPGGPNINWEGAETQLSPCRPVDGQRWAYDRRAQTIVHVASGKCLDTITTVLVEQGTAYWANPAILRDCRGGDSQRWTYDLQTRVLFNGLGVALDIRGGNATNGAKVQTALRNGGAPQQWLADPSPGFSMSVSRTAVTSAANDSFSVHLSTTKLEDARQITLTLDPPNGVVAGVFVATSVMPGDGVDLGFSVPLGTAPGDKGPITITGDNGLEKHVVTVDVMTTACVPKACPAGQCGSVSNGCGGTAQCAPCGDGLVCSRGACLVPRCARPRTCARGFVWDPVECQCVSP